MDSIKVQEKLKEIMRLCDENEGKWISLVVVRSSLPTGEKVRLFNTRGPLGAVKCVKENGGLFEVVALFNRSGVYRCCENIIAEFDRRLTVN